MSDRADGARHYKVLAFIFAINALNVADKSIFGAVLEDIKADFELSDTALGFVSGFAFAVVNSLLAIPLARLADRYSRRDIIALCLASWSLATALCGAAASTLQLMLARAAVGAGEAGHTPAAHSLLSDYFEAERRGFAMSIYAVGAPVGTFLGTSIGGFIAATYDWRLAFVLFGIAGVAVAAAFPLFVREPVRGAADNIASHDPPPSLPEGLRTIGAISPLRSLTFGAAAHLFVNYAVGIWLVPHFLRAYDWSLGVVAFWLGSIIAIFGGLGALAGGLLSDRLARSGGLGWYARLPAIAGSISLPLALAMYTSAEPAVALLFACPVALLWAVWQAPTFALIQTLAPVPVRATAAACIIFIINLVGLGLGPMVTGALSDALAPLAGPESLRWSLIGSLTLIVGSAYFYLRAARQLDRQSLSGGYPIMNGHGPSL